MRRLIIMKINIYCYKFENLCKIQSRNDSQGRPSITYFLSGRIMQLLYVFMFRFKSYFGLDS